jgi:hypothetical protein
MGGAYNSTETKIHLRGGPFDGETIDAIGWVEALVLRDRGGKLHWYLYIEEPMDVAPYGFELWHHSDHTFARACEVGEGASVGGTFPDSHRSNIAHVFKVLRQSMPKCD